MPRAVAWYRFYCHVFALFNVFLLGISVWFILRHEELANEIVNAKVIFWTGLACAPVALTISVVNYWLLMSKRLKNPWSIHMGNIAAGLTTCFLVPLALPLLLAWFKPEVKAWYADR